MAASTILYFRRFTKYRMPTFLSIHLSADESQRGIELFDRRRRTRRRRRPLSVRLFGIGERFLLPAVDRGNGRGENWFVHLRSRDRKRKWGRESPAEHAERQEKSEVEGKARGRADLHLCQR